MKSIGFRCTSTDFSYSIVQGSLDSHELVASKKIKYPTGYNHTELLKWFFHEVGEILDKYAIEKVGVKGTEPMAMKGKNYGERMEMEGMIFLKTAILGIIYSERKVNSTIAKDIGLKGKGKYLAEGFDYSSITDYMSMSKNLQEATQVALSMLE